MLVRTRRVLDRGFYAMKVAILAAIIVLFVVSHSRAFSWLFLAAIIRGAVDVSYPHVKRLAGLPDWAPNEAYITKLYHRFRARDETNDSAALGQ
jgi:hypothetical protein